MHSECDQSPPASDCSQAQSTYQKDYQAWQAAIATYNSTAAHNQQSDDQAAAQVSTSRVQLQNAEASLSALQSSVTPEQVAMDSAQVNSDQLVVNTDQQLLADATLTSPVAGEVAAVNVSVGQTVGSSGGGSTSSSSGSAAASSSFVIITPGAFEVVGNVSDAQIGQVAVGQPALVTPAGATEAVKGTVTSVAPVATVASGVATFPVTVTLTGSNPALRSGMSATVTIIVNQVSGVLTVPSGAVHTTAAGTTVQTLVNGSPQTVTVTVGASDATRTQILSGLNPGDTIVIATVSSTIPSTSSGGLNGSRGRTGFGGGGGAGAGALGG